MKRVAVALAAAFLLVASTPAVADDLGHKSFGFGHGFHSGFAFDPLHFGGVPFAVHPGPFIGHSLHAGPLFLGHRLGRGPFSHRFLDHRTRGYGYLRDYRTGFIGLLSEDLALDRALDRAMPQPSPAAPPVSRRVPAGCRETTTMGYRDGRQAEFGATMCPDEWGKSRIVPGSEYFIRYMR